MNPFQCSSTAGALPWISNHVSESSNGPRCISERLARGDISRSAIRDCSDSTCRSRSVSPRAIGSMPILRIGSFGGRRNLPPPSPRLRRASDFGLRLDRVAVDFFRLLLRRLEVPALRVAASVRAGSGSSRAARDSERRRRRLELAPVGIERGEAGPQRLVLRAALNLRRDRIEQAMLGQRRERSAPHSRSAESCSTPRSSATPTPTPSGRDGSRWHRRSGDRDGSSGATPSRSRAASAPDLPGSARSDRRSQRISPSFRSCRPPT